MSSAVRSFVATAGSRAALSAHPPAEPYSSASTARVWRIVSASARSTGEG